MSFISSLNSLSLLQLCKLASQEIENRAKSELATFPGKILCNKDAY